MVKTLNNKLETLTTRSQHVPVGHRKCWFVFRACYSNSNRVKRSDQALQSVIWFPVITEYHGYCVQCFTAGPTVPSDQNTSLQGLVWTRPTGRRLRTDPEHTGGITFPIWTGSASGLPGGTGRRLGCFTQPAADTTQINAVCQTASSIHTFFAWWGRRWLCWCLTADILHINGLCSHF